MNIQPLYDKILVERDPTERTTRQGIIIPETAREKPQTGTVIACGTGRMLENGTIVPMSLRPGDRVLFSEWAGKEVEFEGKKYLIMSEYDCYGTI